MRFPAPTINSRLFAYVIPAMLIVAFTVQGWAEVVYTPVHVSIPVNQSYNIDVDGNGNTDFTLTSKLIQAYCQSGDEYIWSLTVTAGNGDAVMIELDHIGLPLAVALPAGAQVNSGQAFYPGASMMAELYWGQCSTGAGGEWLNTPNRYLGLRFQEAGGNVHYGWMQLSTAAFVDQHQHLQTSVFVSGYAYETIAGQGILTGQLSR